MTKLTLSLIFALCVALSAGCGPASYDNFSNTTYSLTLDKKEYYVGDSVLLTFEISGVTEVRFYENIEHTMRIWLGLRVEHEHAVDPVLSFDGIQMGELVRRGTGEINTFMLDPNEPLVMDFPGYLSENPSRTAFILEFPKLNKRFTVDKDHFIRAIALEVHGQLRPIKPAEGDPQQDFLGPVVFTWRQR